MTSTRIASLVFKAGALSNLVAAAPAFLAYDKLVEMMNMPEAPRYPFLVMIWAWMGVVWAIAFWEVGNDPVAKRWMIKYFYMEKGTVALSIFLAYAKGGVPLSIPLFSLVTDVLWIVLFAIVHVKFVLPASRE